MCKSDSDVSGVFASSICLSFSCISSIVFSRSNEFFDVVDICLETDLGVMDCRLYSGVIKKVKILTNFPVVTLVQMSYNEGFHKSIESPAIIVPLEFCQASHLFAMNDPYHHSQ